jgi:GntR family transcriptional regulator
LTSLAIDRASVVPIHLRIRENLLAEIRSGHVKPGDPLLSEQQISAQLGVSRMTARQALQSLCSLGVVYRQAGQGYIHIQNPIRNQFRHDRQPVENVKSRYRVDRYKIPNKEARI